MADRPTLHAATEALAEALRQGVLGAPRAWGTSLDRALAGVEEAWRQSPPWKPPEWKEPGVGDMAPSPGIDRKVEELRGALAEVAGNAADLRGQLRRVASGEASVNPQSLVFFRLRAEGLLEALRGLEREEDALALEVAATDIGAGD
jgi:hypothetical protein